ncbi:GD17980 [Drosophila simulans]|uniref:GD17980 n=2 Tax=melanogaster subgroup TaxID=32351 RepID=B4R4Q1_DROSI|nr:GD17980 [Drosophila simulans]
MTMSSTSTATSTATATLAEANATVGEMFSDADMAEVRHVVQRILVPCVFVIGLLGNSVSIYVLTR